MYLPFWQHMAVLVSYSISNNKTGLLTPQQIITGSQQMIISDLNHLETVAELDVLGAGVNFSVFNIANVCQDAYAIACGGKATANKGCASANTNANATNTSVLIQSNCVSDLAIDP